MGKKVKGDSENGSPGIKERRKRPRPLLEHIESGEKQLATGTGVGESKFAKALGSTDFHTRDKGLAALTRWLASRSKVEEGDLLKLWKGIFYCFWHSDKAPVQEDLAKRLAEAQLKLKPPVAFLYFSVALKTLRREWFGIDYLRMDKFLLLIRHFVRQMLVLLQHSGWDEKLTAKYMAEIESGCLLPSDTYPALSVSYHLADIWVDEIDTVADSAAIPSATLVSLLQPFLAALCRSPVQALLNRIRDGVFASAASKYEAGEGAMAGLDGEGMAEALFDAAAGTVKSQKNRVVLYDLNNRWTAAAENRGKAEVEAVSGNSTKGSKKPTKKAKQAKVVMTAEVKDVTDEEQETAGAPAKKQKTGKKKAGPLQLPETNVLDAGHTPMPKKAKKMLAAAAAAAEAALTPAGVSKPAAKANAEEEPLQKSVRFSMKDNLYFKHGGPVADIDVRTPPRARPKGPALKAVSSYGGKTQFKSRTKAKQAAAGSEKQKTQRSPRSGPRPSASDFF